MWTDHTEYEEYQKLNQKNIVIEKNQNKYWDFFFNNAHPYPGLDPSLMARAELHLEVLR